VIEQNLCPCTTVVVVGIFVVEWCDLGNVDQFCAGQCVGIYIQHNLEVVVVAVVQSREFPHHVTITDDGGWECVLLAVVILMP
jgi:proteasome assembly chaperone (PAC2) family protein